MPAIIAIRVEHKEGKDVALNWEVITPRAEANDVEADIVQALLEAVSDRMAEIAKDNKAKATFFVADPGSSLHEKLKIKLPKR